MEITIFPEQQLTSILLKLRSNTYNFLRNLHSNLQRIILEPYGLYEPFQFQTKLQDNLVDIKMGRASKKQKVPSSEQEPAIDVDDENFSEEDEDEMLEGIPDDEIDQNQKNQQLLGIIKAKAEESRQGQQLAWNALHSLKKNEASLTQKMQEEIQAIKDKYELLKQPIYKQISDAALGIKVDNSLYLLDGVPAKIDLKKVGPTAVPNFWTDILTKDDILSSKNDYFCVEKLKQFRCELLDPKTNHINVTFKFSSETDYFSNTQLEVEIKHNPDANQPQRNVKTQIVHKLERDDLSLFTILFDSASNIHEAYNLISKIYDIYSHALEAYFENDSDDEDNEEGENDDQDEDDDSQEVQAVQQPKKKTKTQLKKEIEKPECKQQ